jgi:hypothetical protein
MYTLTQAQHKLRDSKIKHTPMTNNLKSKENRNILERGDMLSHRNITLRILFKRETNNKINKNKVQNRSSRK